MIHSDQQLSDEYYKRIATSVEDSNYTAMPDNMPREPSIIDQETDRSLGNEIDAGGHMIVTVPTMLRQEDDAGTNTDGGDSIYNPHYSVQSIVEVNFITHRVSSFSFVITLFLVSPSDLSSTK